MALLSVADALARILDGVEPTEAESVPLRAARGRVLAGDLASRLTLPPFDASAMDGYAVRAEDVARLPASLKLIGESAAGRGYDGSVGMGEAVRIFTGAPLPPGADAIVIQENTTPGGTAIVVTEGAPDPAHIRRHGSDFTAGAVLLEAGRRLDARALTIAAAMGHAELAVRRRPSVAILATGDELVPPGVAPTCDQIVCSNPYGLAAMVEAAGGEPHLIGIARDTHPDLSDKIAAADGCDILVTIGGASVGDYDLVATVLAERGFVPDFWKIAMRPGKPLLYGRLGPQRVMGVPGNPVSALICARVFLVPLLRRLLAYDEPDTVDTAVLAHGLEANGPRQHYMRARLTQQASGTPSVTAAASQDSSLLSPLISANCIIVRPPLAPALPAGSEVTVLKLDF